MESLHQKWHLAQYPKWASPFSLQIHFLSVATEEFSLYYMRTNPPQVFWAQSPKDLPLPVTSSLPQISTIPSNFKHASPASILPALALPFLPESQHLPNPSSQPSGKSCSNSVHFLSSTDFRSYHSANTFKGTLLSCFTARF